MTRARAFCGSDVRAALAAVERALGPDACIVSTQPIAHGVRIVAEPARIVLPRRAHGAWEQVARTAGLPDALVAALARDAGPGIESAVRLRAARLLASRLRVAPGFGSPVLALVGPTGVGKTTTIAKLAAHALERGRAVRLLTLDVSRPGGVEQLEGLARTLGLRVDVATNTRDFAMLTGEAPANGIVLIDTAGRGPLDRASRTATIEALRRVDAEVHVCLPAGTRRSDAAASLDAWQPLDLRALLVTKWDETAAPGEVLGLAIEREQALSWITVGQTVPGDLVSADPEVIAARVLGLSARDAERLLEGVTQRELQIP